MPPESVITARGLAKHYGPVRAVDGIDLEVRRGEIYAFVGRNGSGKTTTIRMLLGLVRPSAGHVTLLGAPVGPGSQSVFAEVGCLVESATAYPNLTVRENLEIQRRLKHAPADSVSQAIESMRLGEYADRRAERLSLGNRQRLALARALLGEPRLLVLDEPANALDPAGIVYVRGLLRRLADERGVTLFLSSHILTEVALIADRIGIINAGKLVKELDRDALRAGSRAYVEVVVSNPDRAVAILAERLGILRVERMREGGLRLFDGLDRVAEIARVLVGEGLELTHLAAAGEDLETYFMKITESAA
jgi:ABC-2 type transport system ATP-binding protein